ncbi:sugar transferase [Clostridia bacterium]|nr:sugar transferase [Clostridia bacterium]
MYLTVKRMLDILLALILLVPATLLVGICALAIKIESKDPAFFVQERPGHKGEIFRIYKLRTMVIDTERDGKTLTDMDRITKTGKVIRKLSFDELPQIWNILCGQMSFIGPRPLLTSYLPLYTAEQMRRHDVLPGISGWAQVNGRNEISWEQKFRQDVWYVDNVSFIADLKIFWRTILSVVKREGINSEVNNTMQIFSGENTSA